MRADPLAGVHPRLVAAITTILAAMETLGFPMIVTEGLRSDARQQALYAQGRTQPGPIVTQLDGVTHRSRHQVQADGWGHAVDCAFLVQGQPSWAETHPWALYGAMVEALGLVWGGRWTTPHDRPHAELPLTPGKESHASTA